MWRSSRHTWVPRPAACRLHNDKQIPRNHICDINLLHRYFWDVPCSIRCEQGRLCLEVEEKTKLRFYSSDFPSNKMLFLKRLTFTVNGKTCIYACGNPCMDIGHTKSRAAEPYGFATVQRNICKIFMCVGFLWEGISFHQIWLQSVHKYRRYIDGKYVPVSQTPAKGKRNGARCNRTMFHHVLCQEQ